MTEPQNTSKKSPDQNDFGDRRRLLTRGEVAETFGLSHRWLEVAACRGEGPPMVRITARMIRYRASDVEAWISSRVVPGNGEGQQS